MPHDSSDEVLRLNRIKFYEALLYTFTKLIISF